MAEPGNGKQQGKLYTLSEVSKRTGISMPTLQRYKKLYQGRIPSEGSGRKQRYPDSALAVFTDLKQENVGRRGRPRKDASAAAPAARKAAAGRKPGARQASSGRPATAKAGKKAAKGGAKGRAKAAKTARSGNLLTLTEISKRTGISYPTAVRYVRLYSDRLPHEGKGRARRFYPEAVDVFRQLRQEGGRGGRKSGAAAGAKRRGRPAKDEGFLANRVRDIERAQENLEKRIKGLISSLQKLVR